MTFRLDLANRANLFGNYASWYEDENILDKSHISFTFSICYLINSLENIHKYKSESLCQFELLKGTVKGQAEEICFQTPSLFNLFSEVSISLTQIRILQNTLLDLIGKKLQISISPSMNTYVTKLNKRKRCDLEERVHSLISDYWNISGLKVKQYRDIDQHYGQLFQHAIIKRSGDIANLELRLPDNPKEKSPKRFTYQLKIDAVLFIHEAFNSLHTLINEVSVMLGYKKQRLFDLNIATNENYDNYLTVVFDPYKGSLTGQEVIIENGSHYGVTHIEQCDLEQFSFIKLPKFFKVKELPKHDYLVGKKFKFKEG